MCSENSCAGCGFLIRKTALGQVLYARVWCISQFRSQSCFVFSQVKEQFLAYPSQSSLAKFYTSEIQTTLTSKKVKNEN